MNVLLVLLHVFGGVVALLIPFLIFMMFRCEVLFVVPRRVKLRYLELN